MSRYLITAGIALVVVGLLWPYLGKLGFGRLPGDIAIERDGLRFYFPLVTCAIVSAAITLILWLLRK